MESGTRNTRESNGAHGPSSCQEAAQSDGPSASRLAPRTDESAPLNAVSLRARELRPRSLAELLRCPAAVSTLLNGCTLSLGIGPGDVVFNQSDMCRGLYVVISGHFVRRAERLESRLTLNPARPGDLVELAAVLGDGRHTYSLKALIEGSVLLLPMDALGEAFTAYPPLRMQMLEELAREVSRGYDSCAQIRVSAGRRRLPGAVSP
jgi:CRP-like cAMP-binding protein